MAIYLYDANTKDFSNNGLVGALQPSECHFEEQKNGVSQLTMVIPYDQLGKWKQAQVGRYLKAPVPARTPPVMGDSEYAQMVNVYRVIDNSGE